MRGLSPSVETRICLGVPFEKLTTQSLPGLFQGDNKMKLLVLPVGNSCFECTHCQHHTEQISGSVHYCPVCSLVLRAARHHTHAFSAQ